KLSHRVTRTRLPGHVPKLPRALTHPESEVAGPNRALTSEMTSSGAAPKSTTPRPSGSRTSGARVVVVVVGIVVAVVEGAWVVLGSVAMVVGRVVGGVSGVVGLDVGEAVVGVDVAMVVVASAA